MDTQGTIRTTSQDVIDRMLSMTTIESGQRVLEPSAGIGILADGIMARHPDCNLQCVELNDECVSTLKNKGYNVIRYNFLHYRPKQAYDRIIASPTFKDNVDCEHVMHMHELLADGGEIVSLMSPAWMTGET